MGDSTQAMLSPPCRPVILLLAHWPRSCACSNAWPSGRPPRQATRHRQSHHVVQATTLDTVGNLDHVEEMR